jgi:hypothetical protein
MLGPMRPLPVLLSAPLVLAACSHRPPPDFAPDPALVAHIRAIELHAPRTACPGYSFPVTYTAVLDDGRRIPFESRYDKKHPPRLHVVFLDRESEEATPLQDGGWAANRDPLVSVQTGFRLRVALDANPAIADSVTIPPSYDCLDHSFVFSGHGGARGRDGGDGPDVTVRLALGHSAFYDRLLIVAIEVGQAPPFYLLADPDALPPRDWLIVQSRGGSGGDGEPGTAGKAGAAGADGQCPAADGGRGQDGQDGARGGDGGRGGRITIIAPAENPFLAGLVDARTPGGRRGDGGKGGAGGAGGVGGAGGITADRRNCAKGQTGPAGRAGDVGHDGRDGRDGPNPTVITVPSREVLGQTAPPELLDLVDTGRRRP